MFGVFLFCEVEFESIDFFGIYFLDVLCEVCITFIVTIHGILIHFFCCRTVYTLVWCDCL